MQQLETAVHCNWLWPLLPSLDLETAYNYSSPAAVTLLGMERLHTVYQFNSQDRREREREETNTEEEEGKKKSKQPNGKSILNQHLYLPIYMPH